MHDRAELARPKQLQTDVDVHRRLAASGPESVLASPGAPLALEARRFLEPSLGHDFSGVRVHTDGRAARSAQQLGAAAWTFGNDVAFAAGMYAPSTRQGMGLLAHELTHVVQQRSASVGAVGIGPADDDFEREADRHASAALLGNQVRVSSLAPVPQPRIQRSVLGAIGSALGTIGKGLLNAALFIPRLFGLDYFPVEDLKKYLQGIRERKGPELGIFGDNKARACVSREAELGPYDTQTKTWLIQDMLDGWTSGSDESSIISLLRRSSDKAELVAAVGRDRMWAKFSGQNRRIIEAMTMSAADAGEGLISRLRSAEPAEIQDYLANAADPAVAEAARRALALSNITAPVPSSAAVTPAGHAELQINGVEITVEPDRFIPSLGQRAWTKGQFNVDRPAPFNITPANKDERVGDIVVPPTIRLRIWSEFASPEAREGRSAYGVGTRQQDTPTLRYHERAHGEGWLNFIRGNPPPEFKANPGMTFQVFNAAVEQWSSAYKAWVAKATDFALRAGDCVGTLPTDEQLKGTAVTAAICHQVPAGAPSGSP